MLINSGFYIPKDDSRLSQGSVLTDVIYRYIQTDEEGIRIEETTLPFFIVLNQDCELEQDSGERNSTEQSDSQDKHLTSIVGVPAFLAEDLRQGQHFADFNLAMRNIPQKEWKYIEENQRERYYCIKRNDEFDLPALAIDFKHFYTFKYEELASFIKANPDSHKCRINFFFREDLSRRFTSFISRIAVPNEIIPKSPVKEIEESLPTQ